MKDVAEIAEKPGKAAQAKRKKRREAIMAANKITVILETDLRQHLSAAARAAGMDIAPYLLKLVEEQVIATAPEGDALGDRLRARRAVLDHVVTAAQARVAAGGFDENFILNVMKDAAQDAEFTSLYQRAVGEADRPARSARAALNQQMARLIKRAAGARSKRDEAGKIMRAQVQDEIITSYTLLDKPA